MVSAAQIWDWLAEVPDPEIPAVSLVDLGIVRDVTVDENGTQVTVTPTYSGCPATAVIALDIETHLAAKGLQDVRLHQQLTPPWTTDWITEAGRNKLEGYGIAPPQPAGGPERCPLCQSPDVERISQFGSTPCKAQWRCNSCLEPFDYFKCF